MDNINQQFLDKLSKKISINVIKDADNKRNFLNIIEPTFTIKDIYKEYPLAEAYLEHHVGTPHGNRMEYMYRDYISDILKEDYSKPIVVQKCVQCGISEYALSTAFYFAQEGLSVLYVLPNHGLRGRFVGARVDKAIEQSYHYKSLLKQTRKDNDSRSLKHFGKGCIYFVGSNTVGELSELSADMIIIDEYDICESSNLSLIQDRLAASKYKYRLYISNPRRFGPSGIGALYNYSDQKVWMIPCNHCGKEQELKWDKHFIDSENNLIDKDGNPVCEYCSKPFNRLNKGKWAAHNNISKISGYKISQLYSSNIDILALHEHYMNILGNNYEMSIFCGSVLGEYYTGGADAITLDLLSSCIDDTLLTWPEININKDNNKPLDKEHVNIDKEDIVLGVDVGSKLHYTICKIFNNKRIYIHAGTVPSFEALNILADKYKPSVIVMDAMPELHSARTFALSTPYTTFLCRFVEGAESIKVKYGDNNDPVNYINVNRTLALDGSLADIKNKMVSYPRSIINVTEFFNQMLVPRREYNDDKEKYIYTKGTDHYRFADLYQWLGCQIIKGAIISLDYL